MAHDNDLDKARDSRRDRTAPNEPTYPTYGAFVSRKTFTIAHAPTGNNVDLQLPCSITGTEAEGVVPTINTASNITQATNISDTGLNTGAPCICRHVQNRWATTNYSTKGYINQPGCPCTFIPTTLNLTSSKPSSNNQIFQNATLQYGPPPSGLSALNLGANCFLSTIQFKDFSTNDWFWYYFGCFQGFYILTRVYETSTYASPYRDQIRYRWLAGTFGNTCSPFSLTAGTIFSGGDASCIVTVVE